MTIEADSSRRRFLKNLGLVSGAFATGAFAAENASAHVAIGIFLQLLQ